MKKFTNKKGFTIMEMLIVVAIIAVLVAIAIPTFTSALTKAEEATDVANIRAAYAAVQVEALTNGTGTTSIVGSDDKAKKENFVQKAGASVSLKHADQLTLTTKGSNVEVSYNPKELTGGNGSASSTTGASTGVNAYTWTLNNCTLTNS